MWEKHRASGVIEINSLAPDFSAPSTQGQISFHDWAEGSWVLFVSHRKDYAPVCTSELGVLARMHDAFARRNAKIICIGAEPLLDHEKWLRDVEKIYKAPVRFPVVADEEMKVASLYGMIHRRESRDQLSRSAIIIDPALKVRMVETFPMTVGRNFEELLRVIEALQLHEGKGVVTPANWQAGDMVLIPPNWSDDDATRRCPGGWKRIRDYFRVAQAD